jgi:hypothetical protein
MPARPLPNTTNLAALLSDLLGKRTDVQKGPPVGTGPKDKVVVGAYLRDDGAVAALLACDLALAAQVGASLALIPPKVAADAIKAGQLPENLGENFGEVLNVAGGALNAAGAPHVAYRGMHQLPPPPPPEVAALLKQPAARLDLTLNVAGYGPGRLSILVGAL